MTTMVEVDKLYREGGHGCSHTVDNIAHLHARFSSRSLNLAQE